MVAAGSGDMTYDEAIDVSPIVAMAVEMSNRAVLTTHVNLYAEIIKWAKKHRATNGLQPENRVSNIMLIINGTSVLSSLPPTPFYDEELNKLARDEN